MPGISPSDLLRNYLASAKAAQSSFEARLRGFLAETRDDLDLQAVFLADADRARVHTEQLEALLADLGGGGETTAGFSGSAELPGALSNANHIQEERALHNLVAAFGIHQSGRAVGEVLATLASATGQGDTERLGREIESQARESAERVFGLIRSRAKIAFNMLTPNELDPAIETKMADDRVV